MESMTPQIMKSMKNASQVRPLPSGCQLVGGTQCTGHSPGRGPGWAEDAVSAQSQEGLRREGRRLPPSPPQPGAASVQADWQCGQALMHHLRRRERISQMTPREDSPVCCALFLSSL